MVIVTKTCCCLRSHGLHIPFVENQSWWPSHHHQSTEQKYREIITGLPVSW